MRLILNYFGSHALPAAILAGFLLIASYVPAACAADPNASISVSDSFSNTRYGPFGLFDSRSLYGKGVLPEPFLVDDSDLEVNELRLDWFHSEARGQVGNRAKAEFEKGFGLLTVEVELPYESNSSETFNPRTRRNDFERVRGVDAIAVGVRHPIFQYVSRDEFIDSTFGAAVEVGIPSNSPTGKHAEIVPKLFEDLRLGEHVTLQCVLGCSFLRGSAPEGGTETFEYGLVFGYMIPHRELPLPDVEQLVPVLELKGETLLDTHAAGSNSLLGDLALRVNLRAIGRVQPRLGLGYVFPIDRGARDNLRWGVITSLVFEF